MMRLRQGAAQRGPADTFCEALHAAGVAVALIPVSAFDCPMFTQWLSIRAQELLTYMLRSDPVPRQYLLGHMCSSAPPGSMAGPYHLRCLTDVQMRLRNPSLLRQLHGVAQRQPGLPASPKPSPDSSAIATLRQSRSRG